LANKFAPTGSAPCQVGGNLLARGLDAVIRMAPRHQWLMPSIPKEVLSDTELDQVIAYLKHMAARRKAGE
ncbi:hypothetical protein KDX24_30015, partial [Pseudomonas sp. CDFA 550]|nr:hypothetical protein [Pseudomonas quasicaspiana]